MLYFFFETLAQQIYRRHAGEVGRGARAGTHVVPSGWIRTFRLVFLKPVLAGDLVLFPTAPRLRLLRIGSSGSEEALLPHFGPGCHLSRSRLHLLSVIVPQCSPDRPARHCGLCGEVVSNSHPLSPSLAHIGFRLLVLIFWLKLLQSGFFRRELCPPFRDVALFFAPPRAELPCPFFLALGFLRSWRRRFPSD